jgi:hypothetical protein
MKFAAERPSSDPEKAARKLVEIANATEAVQDGRIFIELINWPFLAGRWQPGRIRRGPRPSDRKRLALEA